MNETTADRKSCKWKQDLGLRRFHFSKGTDGLKRKSMNKKKAVGRDCGGEEARWDEAGVEETRRVPSSTKVAGWEN